jgi:hypothetical protein
MRRGIEILYSLAAVEINDRRKWNTNMEGSWDDRGAPSQIDKQRPFEAIEDLADDDDDG